MVQQATTAVESNFTKGLLTEFTGLNFPPNAATDTDNCTYTLVGDVTRRLGIDFEENFVISSIIRTDSALNTYKWNNAGGDGQTQLIVAQLNGILHFWRSSSATEDLPLSTKTITSTVTMSDFVALGGTFDKTLECQFSSGNGYLFVTHPSCDPMYCTYNAGVITGNAITVKIRDFSGVSEAGVPVNTRPTSLTVEHNYNLINQGWTAGNPWSTNSSSIVIIGLGSKTFTVSSGLTVTLGDEVTIISLSAGLGGPTGPIMSGNITAYAGTSMTVSVTSGASGWFGISANDWLIVPRNEAYITDWFSSIGSYPSNADVWWYFKDATGNFNPGSTASNTSLSSGKAPRGHFVLDAFSQQRDVLSGLAITDVSTTVRPKTTTWFQGRVWYAGTDAQQPATGNMEYYTWSESIFFSQVIYDNTDFGNCYQTNDPTSQTLFDLLPTDGGVIQIQGSGNVYKLFPVQNGLLVFAANGIWFITGSQGIGFSANDYTITKISSVQSISGTSFVNVLGYPFFWNEEGIYSVTPGEKGGWAVDPITVATIQTFFDAIPPMSKKFVRGDYHPIDYTIQWIYRDTPESSLNDRYEFNRILNYNTYNKAFFPYSVSAPRMTINGINYISNPVAVSSPDPTFKYMCTSNETTGLTWADEHDENYVDFVSDAGGEDFDSYFVTGYRLTGQALKRFQIPYVYTFSRNSLPSSFSIQGLWDYATSGNSGRWSTKQLINNWAPNFGMLFRRHRIRGQGLVLQIKVTSVSGQPFNLMGWSMPIQVNASV